MEKVIEINKDRVELKEYLEECLTEEKIDYEIKIEGRWIQHFKQASEYYEVYCIYVNDNNINKVNKFVEDFEKATIITDDIEELKNVEEEEEDDNELKTFTRKNFLIYYWCAIIVVGILIAIGIKFIF